MQESVNSLLPVWACLCSLIAEPLIVIFRKEIFLREMITFGAAFAKFGFVLAMLPILLDGKIITCSLIDGVSGLNVPILFRVDGLGMVFALVASSLWIVTSLYGVGYMRGLKEHSQTRFFAFFAISLCATLGVAFAGNLLTLYLFYEMLSLATWPLVTHHQDKEARTGGRTYLTYLLGTSIAFAIPALIFTFIQTEGDLSFAGPAILASTDMTAWSSVILLMAFAFGFSKAGMMPFHSWLPGAMVAPTPVSALLHAVAVVKVGVFCVIRVVTEVFDMSALKQSLGAINVNEVLCWFASFTIIVSSLIALTQDNLKRRLAFSTIGQLSYIILGAALLHDVAAQGAALHIAAHAVGKITLFMCAGAIYVATGKKYLSEMVGIGRRMPITMGAFFVGAMSVIGLPPTFGFVSKWHIFVGALSAGQFVFVIVLIISSILNIAYLLPPVWKAFFPGKETEFDHEEIKEAPWTCVAPVVITSVLCVALFFFPNELISLTKNLFASK